MNRTKILVVEDDRSIMSLITTTLTINGYDCIRTEGGNEAVTLFTSYHPSLVLLDLGLPDIDGIDVIRTIRQWSQVPIIVVSARTDDSDKIEALDQGADDYLTKPFSVDELMARIRAAMRRADYITSASDDPVYRNNELEIDYSAGIVRMSGNEIHMTPIEYRLLSLLARNTGKVLTHAYIIQNIWGTAVDTDIVSLRVYMNALRRKLKQDSSAKPYIRTHVGIGYQMIKSD